LNHPESLIVRSQEIVDIAQQELKEYLGRISLPIDYLTVIPEDEEDQLCLSGEAAALGTKIFSKNGDIFRIDEPNESELSVIRVRKPVTHPETDNDVNRIGTVDFVSGDYRRLKELLFVNASIDEKFDRKIRGKGEDAKVVPYSIVRIDDPALRVGLYFPSLRITDAIRRVTAE